MIKVAVSSPSFSKCSQLVAELSAIPNITAILNTDGERFDENGLATFIAETGADVLILGTEPLSEKVIASSQQLRAIVKYGVGTDNVDFDAIKSRELFFGWSPGVNRRSVSELVLAFAIGHLRNVLPSLSRMSCGKWIKEGGRQLSDATIGIVGFGHVGGDLADLLRPFGCELLVHDILDKSAEAANVGAEQVSYLELLGRSDVVTFHVPLTSDTSRMFTARQIALCRKKPLIINTSRGQILEFGEVTQAVKDGIIGGYAADVFDNEPFTEGTEYSPANGFYFTPHIGGNAHEAILAMGRSAIMHLEAFLKI